MHREVKAAMGEWIGGLAPWNVFSRWTFSRPVNVQGAIYMARRHLRWVEKAAGLWGRECCLVHGCPCGIARVLPYEPELDAGYYISKYMTKQLGAWELFGFAVIPQLPLPKN